MAVSVSNFRPPRVPGFYSVTLVTLDNSYAEGGEKVTFSQLQMDKVDFALCNIINGPESEEFVGEAWYDNVTEKIHLISSKTGKEVAKEKDMSKVVVAVLAFGKARVR